MGKGEVATSLEAFRLQYDKAFTILCQRAKKAVQLGDHDSCQASYLSRSKVECIVDEYRQILPSSAMVPVLLELGNKICSTPHVGHSILAIALDCCYKPVARLLLFKASGDK